MCCGIESAVNCAAVTGFLQFAVAAGLLLVGTKLDPASQSCPFGPNEDSFPGSLCAAINTLGVISIVSALILLVFQGLLLMLCGAGAAVLEVIGRSVLAMAWLAMAIVTTVFGAKAKHKGRGDPSDPDWILATIIMCWIMFMLSVAMVGAAIARLAMCCCCPSTAVAAAGVCCFCPQRQGCLYSCAEILCLAWLLNWLCASPPQVSYDAGGQRRCHHGGGYYQTVPSQHHDPLIPHDQPVARPVAPAAGARYPTIDPPGDGFNSFIAPETGAPQAPAGAGWAQPPRHYPGAAYTPFASSSAAPALGVPVDGSTPPHQQHYPNVGGGSGPYEPPPSVGYPDKDAPSAPPAPYRKG